MASTIHHDHESEDDPSRQEGVGTVLPRSLELLRSGEPKPFSFGLEQFPHAVDEISLLSETMHDIRAGSVTAPSEVLTTVLERVGLLPPKSETDKMSERVKSQREAIRNRDDRLGTFATLTVIEGHDRIMETVDRAEGTRQRIQDFTLAYKQQFWTEYRTEPNPDELDSLFDETEQFDRLPLLNILVYMRVSARGEPLIDDAERILRMIILDEHKAE